MKGMIYTGFLAVLFGVCVMVSTAADRVERSAVVDREGIAKVLASGDEELIGHTLKLTELARAQEASNQLVLMTILNRSLIIILVGGVLYGVVGTGHYWLHHWWLLRRPRT